jgi:hypothetical protein
MRLLQLNIVCSIAFVFGAFALTELALATTFQPA